MDPRSSLTETKSGQNNKLKGAANRKSPVISAFMPQEHQLRMRSGERDFCKSFFKASIFVMRIVTLVTRRTKKNERLLVVTVPRMSQYLLRYIRM